MTTKEPIAAGTQIDQCYRIERVLGQGGFGRTYLALNTKRFNEPCVLKEFVPQVTTPDIWQKSLELFQREAETLYRLNHPQIPRFLAWFEAEGRWFIVQEYVNGKSYQDLLRDRLHHGQTFTEAEVITWLKAMLPVLHYIHSHDIVHRDIAPDNIMLPQDESLPVLIDFGVVKQAMEGSLANTSRIAGSLTVGKLGYAPPEQIRTAHCSPRGDLYSLAATAVVLLTGRQPSQLFDAQELEWRWRSHAQVSDAFAQILDTMLADKPRDRYPSAAGVLEALNSDRVPIPLTFQSTRIQSTFLPSSPFPTVVSKPTSAELVEQKSPEPQGDPANTANPALSPQFSSQPSSQSPPQPASPFSSQSASGETASPTGPDPELKTFSSVSAQLPPELKSIAEPLLDLAQDQFTGRLTIQGSQRSWYLYYCIGRLAWANSSYLPNRRFLRRFQTSPDAQLPQLDLAEIKLLDPPHYALMLALAKRNPLTSTKVTTTMVRAMLGEVLFDLFQYADPANFRFTPEANAGIPKSSTLMSCIIRPENAIPLAAETWIQWQKVGLAHCCPDLAPLIKRPERLQQQVSESTYNTLVKMANGQRTLREIALLLKQNLRQLSLSLLPYFQQDVIGLNRVNDITLPFFTTECPITPSPIQTVTPLIACIDDSPHVFEIIRPILEAQGYRFLGIQDPLRAIPTLLTQKPALIFLDLVMPVANGYEVCSQIRRVSTLKQIPIVILTGNDGVVDRIRATMVGASDFLSKPIDEKKLLKVLQQHCPLSITKK